MEEHRIIEYGKRYEDDTVWAPGACTTPSGTRVPIMIDFDLNKIIGTAEVLPDETGVTIRVQADDGNPLVEIINRHESLFEYAPGFTAERQHEMNGITTFDQADIIETGLIRRYEAIRRAV